MSEKPVTFQEAMREAARTAKEENRVIYVYHDQNKGYFWEGPYIYWTWLFKAYPGGRTEISIAGQKHL